MKNTYIKIFSIFLAIFSIIGCEDDEKDPLFVDTDRSNDAVFVTIKQKTVVIDFTDSSTSYDFTIESPANNVAEYSISVKRTSAGVSSDTIPITTVNSFPAEFSYTAEELADFLSVPVANFAAGDRFDFIATAKGNNGLDASFENLNSDSRGPGQFQGFNHTTFLSCPFNSSEIPGTYAITGDGGGGLHSNGDTFEVISGPGPNQYSVVGFGDENLIINVDPETGISIPSDEEVFLVLASGTKLTAAPANAGFTFSCTGTIFLTAFEYTCCGSFALTMKKQ